MKQANERSRRGLTLIESALALAVLSLIMVGVFTMMNEQADRRRASNVAQQMTMITRAAENYVKANAEELRVLTGTRSPVRIDVARRTSNAPVPSGSLQDGGYLPSSFVDSNAYGQSHYLVVRQVSRAANGRPARLEALLVAQGGRDIPDSRLGQIATEIGASGGFMAADPIGVPAGVVSGTGGGWAAIASEWSTDGVGPTPGRPVVAMALDETAITNDFISRRDVGNPEANRMRTNLSMGDETGLNSITDIQSLTSDLHGSKSIDLGVDSMLTITNMLASVQMAPDGTIRLRDDVSVARNLAVGQDITAARNVTAGEDVVAERDVVGQRFVDANDRSYIVDPSGNTNVNRLSARYFNLDAVAETTNAGLRDQLKPDETVGDAMSRLWGCRLEYRYTRNWMSSTGNRGAHEGIDTSGANWVQGPLMDGDSNTGAMSRWSVSRLSGECNGNGCGVQMRMNCPDRQYSAPPPTEWVGTPEACPAVTGAILVGDTPPHCLYEPTAEACPSNMTEHASSTPSRRICVLTIIEYVEVPGPTPPPTPTSYSWFTSNWDDRGCSNACGSHFVGSFRSVWCQSSTGQQVSNGMCPANSMPNTSRVCPGSHGPCN